jgi:hypothetical protein
LQLEDRVALHMAHLSEELQADVLALLKDKEYGRFARAACEKKKVYVIIESVLHVFGFHGKCVRVKKMCEAWSLLCRR